MKKSLFPYPLSAFPSLLSAFSALLSSLLFACTLHAQTPSQNAVSPKPPISTIEPPVAIAEPYQPLHGGAFSGPTVRESPDPLVAYHWENPRAGDPLESYTLKPESVKGFPQNAFEWQARQPGRKNDPIPGISKPSGSPGMITVRGQGSLQLDFGVESAGWLEFDSDDLPDSVEMSISEYNEPAIVNTGAQHPQKTARPVKYGHTYRLELNDGLYEGVRFGWIHVRQHTRVWHIRNPRLVCQAHPANYIGSFSCSDPLLTRIWYTGAYTVRLNFLRDYFGAILMERSDRQSWTGDAYPAQAAALAAFGNYDFIRANIRTTAGQDNGIASYPLYWVLSLIDYYRYSGDSTFFREYAGNADKKLTSACQGYDTLPSLGFMGWDERLGAGFEHPQTPEAQHTYQMLCIHTWKTMAAALQASGDVALAAKYQDYAASKSRDLASAPSFGIHAASEAVNAGLGGNPAIAAASGKWFADRLNRLSYSPFNQYFIIQAMASAGQYEAALGTIKDCWGGQLLYGGTSFFEVYRPSWNTILRKNDPPPNNQCGYTSLAHPWGAGVTKWLSENILGIRPLSPGFRCFEILPYLRNSLTRVAGDMPTPAGPITASFDIRSGHDSVVIPAGLLAECIGIPRANGAMNSMTVNGILLWRNDPASPTVEIPAAIGSIAEDSQFVYLLHVQPGHYTIRCTYRQAPGPRATTTATGAKVVGTTVSRSKAVSLKNSRLQSPGRNSGFVYPVHFLAQDTLLAGQWKRKYGKDGYELFGYEAANRSWPSYIEEIRYEQNGSVIWDSSTSDSRVLMLPEMDKGKAAAIITGDPAPTRQTFTIDIVLKREHSYCLSLYFLDWNGPQIGSQPGSRQKKPANAPDGRRTAVELLDLETLNILAPVEMVRDYTRGRYVRFRFHKSVRIRIDQVRGRNAAVSGIFFDPS